MSVTNIAADVFSFLTNKEIFPSLLIFAASMTGIIRFARELRFRSVMTGMTEKIERIHSRNDSLEEFCSIKISSLLDDLSKNQNIEFLNSASARKIEKILFQLTSKSIGSSRQLDTYSFFLRHCLSKAVLIDRNTSKITKNSAFNILIQGLEIIQKQALTIIESPEKIKLEKKSHIRSDLRKYTSSKGFNSTPNVEIGPSANESTDEALYFYAACLRQNLSFHDIELFENFFEIIRGNHPFCILMAAEKLLLPTKLLNGSTSDLFGKHAYHAINFRSQRIISSGHEFVEIMYANLSTNVTVSLAKKDPRKLLDEISFDGIKTDLKKSSIKDLKIVNDKYIVLKFEKSVLEKEFSRNQKNLEWHMHKKAGTLNLAKKAQLHVKHFFTFKC